ncbi:hypothetical protein [Sphaerisporangium sp. TRM90804]|uniref:hypothetical protein n=1 Tax=Sphaerisporangium sp. TRM90804 TaxID=3031113 RepID=UPI00244C4483|nr:hypothetical protein [Sphaerisporangium sp. TRM90804]MDH2428097.1 hypothetical protein [Sphaerisporangium sp. TRM90804]
MSDELESTRQALQAAVAAAAGAAELARLLEDYQRRLAEAAASEAEAVTRRREAEARLKAVEKRTALLARNLAEQRYQTEVAQWRLEGVQGSRWSRLGDAIHTKNPGEVARTLKSPVSRRPAPKRSDFSPVPPPAEAEPVAPAVPEPSGPAVSTAMAEGFVVPKGPLTRPYLTVAAIVDRQSEALFRYEWRQVTNFGPDNWREMLDEHRPHLLFVESVRPGPRQGNGGRWLEELAGRSRGLRDLVEECGRRGIRTVFWHSGGPVSVSVPMAGYFDHVLATSQQRAREWRAALRHDRVAVLPHAVQPRVHNLIPAAPRPTAPRPAPTAQPAPTAETASEATPGLPGTSPDAASGAASHTARPGLDPATQANGGAASHGPLPVANGRAGVGLLGTVLRGAPPADLGWRPLIDGKASYDDLLIAYRSVSLVLAGPDAEARTLAELAACGTPVMRLTAPVEADEEALRRTAEAVTAHLAAEAERTAEAHHAWRASVPVTPLLDPILDWIGVPSVRNTAEITAIAAVTGQAELDNLLAALRHQARRPGQLVIVAEGLDGAVVEKAAQAVHKGELTVREAREPVTRGAALDRALRLADGDLVAVLDPRDRYGEHYLADLAAYLTAVDAEIIGKASFYTHIQSTGATLLRQPGAEHRFLPEVTGGTVLARRQTLTALGIADLSEDWDETLMRQCRTDGIRVYSADRHNYTRTRPTPTPHLLTSAHLLPDSTPLQIML